MLATTGQQLNPQVVSQLGAYVKQEGRIMYEACGVEDRPPPLGQNKGLFPVTRPGLGKQSGSPSFFLFFTFSLLFLHASFYGL